MDSNLLYQCRMNFRRRRRLMELLTEKSRLMPESHDSPFCLRKQNHDNRKHTSFLSGDSLIILLFVEWLHGVLKNWFWTKGFNVRKKCRAEYYMSLFIGIVHSLILPNLQLPGEYLYQQHFRCWSKFGIHVQTELVKAPKLKVICHTFYGEFSRKLKVRGRGPAAFVNSNI